MAAERRVVGHSLCFRVSGRVSLVVETFDGANGMVCSFVFETKDRHAVGWFEEVRVDFPA